MERFAIAALMALACSAISITTGPGRSLAADGSLQLGLHGGTLGLGANAGFSVSEQLTMRAMINYLELDYEETESGNRYDGDLDLQSFGLVAEWHPFANGFRLTGGAFLNNNEVSATAQDDDLDIGGTAYDARMSARVDFDSIAPYLGVGFDSGFGEPGFGFAFDVGVLYQGSPRISGSGSVGNNCSFEISRGGAATISNGCPGGLKADLELEHADLEDDIDGFVWYPALSLGVSYRY